MKQRADMKARTMERIFRESLLIEKQKKDTMLASMA
jgi:hypothetical protein